MGGGLLTNTTKGEVIVNSGIGSNSLRFSIDSTSVSLAGGLTAKTGSKTTEKQRRPFIYVTNQDFVFEQKVFLHLLLANANKFQV